MKKLFMTFTILFSITSFADQSSFISVEVDSLEADTILHLIRDELDQKEIVDTQEQVVDKFDSTNPKN